MIGYGPDSGEGPEEDRLDAYAAFHQERVRTTAHLIQAAKPPPGPILDIGASPLSASLPNLWPGREIWVVDPDPTWATRLAGSAVRFAAGSLLDLELPFPPGKFSVVVASEVFEHLPECAPHLLGPIARVTAPGGLVGVTVPNQARLANRVRLLLGESVAEPPTRAYHRPWMGYGHLHEYTLSELVRDCRDPNLVLVDFGAFDPYDRGRYQPLISLVGALGLTGWQEVLYGIFRRGPSGVGAPPGPKP
jgi:SAM-dependent methyltransferase